jgi:hypothetical protein
MFRLDPPLPFDTPKGKAMAHFLIDYGPEHHLLWVCFQDETGECWTWPNKDVRLQPNLSMGRSENNFEKTQKISCTPKWGMP